MKNFVATFIFIITIQILGAQDLKVDSLKQKLSTIKADTTRLQILNSLVELINDESQWTPYNDQMGKLSMSLLDNENEHIKKVAEKFYAAYILNLGYLYDMHGNIPKAIEYFRKSLQIQERIGDKKGMGDGYSNIGNIYRGQGDLAKALDYYLKGLAVRKSINDSVGIANSFYSIGIISKMQGDTDRTLEYFVESLRMQQSSGHLMGVADVQLNIGDIYLMKGDATKALDYYLKSYKIHKQIGDEEGTVNSLSKIGNLYLAQTKLNDALFYATSALTLSKSLGYPHLIRNSAELLKNIYKQQHNYAAALEMNDLFMQMRDSTINESTRKATIDQQMQYEFEKKEALLKSEQEKKDVLAKEEIDKQKIIRNAIAAGAFVLIISTILSLLFYKRKQDAVMQHKITDSRLRAINAQMNPHFIFNCMSSIQSLITNKDLQSANNCLVRFTKLIRKVLDNSMQTEISLEDDLETLNDYIELEKLRLDFPLTYNLTIEGNLNTNEIFIPPLLIQPFVENSIMHGLKSKDGMGIISINILKRDKQLEIEIADNGIGRNKNATSESNGKRKSYGIPLTKERLDYLGAFNKIKPTCTIEDIISNEKQVSGTKVILTIPLLKEN